MAPRIFITFSAGSLGNEIITRLAMIGEQIQVGVDKNRKEDLPFHYASTHTVPFDFSRITSINEALYGIEKVILLVPCVPQMDQFVSNVISSAKKSDVKYIVFISLFGVQKEPQSIIGNWYQSCEQMIINSQLSYSIIRPNFSMQGLLQFIEFGNGNLNLPFSDAAISFIDERDIAAAAAEITLDSEKHPKCIHELTGIEAKSLPQISEIFSEISGRTVSYSNPSDEQTKVMLENKKIDTEIINPLISYFNFLKSGSAAKIFPILQKITYSSPVTLIDFVRDYAQVIRDQVDGVSGALKSTPLFT